MMMYISLCSTHETPDDDQLRLTSIVLFIIMRRITQHYVSRLFRTITGRSSFGNLSSRVRFVPRYRQLPHKYTTRRTASAAAAAIIYLSRNKTDDTFAARGLENERKQHQPWTPGRINWSSRGVNRPFPSLSRRTNCRRGRVNAIKLRVRRPHALHVSRKHALALLYEIICHLLGRGTSSY